MCTQQIIGTHITLLSWRWLGGSALGVPPAHNVTNQIWASYHGSVDTADDVDGVEETDSMPMLLGVISVCIFR